jgi:hypothetical protein
VNPQASTAGRRGIVELLAQHGELAPHCVDHRLVDTKMNVR